MDENDEGDDDEMNVHVVVVHDDEFEFLKADNVADEMSHRYCSSQNPKDQNVEGHEKRSNDNHPSYFFVFSPLHLVHRCVSLNVGFLFLALKHSLREERERERER